MTRLLQHSALLALLAAPAIAQVPNDECSGAIFVVDGLNGPFSNVGSTTSSPAWPCGAGGNDVWYAYVASCCGTVTFDLCSPTRTYDTTIQAFRDDGVTQTCSTGFTSGSCNDDSCGLGSSVTVNTGVGDLWYIRVGGFGSGTGSFDLTVTCTAAGGGGGIGDDECTAPTPIVTGLNAGFSNVGYTTSSPWPCAIGGSDRWFLYRATCTAPHTFATCSANTTYDTCIEVMTNGCPCPIGLGCNDDFCGLQSQLTVNLTNGVSYLVRVGGFASGTGNFDLIVSTGTASGTIALTTPTACASPMAIAVTGDPNIGGTITVSLTGGTGVPFCGFGFAPYVGPIPGCGCSILGNGSGGFGFFSFGGSCSLTLPCRAQFIGATLDCQGIDLFPTSGGCAPPSPFLPFGATDIYTVTFG